MVKNTRKAMYQFVEEKLKIEQPHKKIEFQRIPRFEVSLILLNLAQQWQDFFGIPIESSYWKMLVNISKAIKISMPLHELRKLKMKKFKEAREREDTRRILAKQARTNFLSTANMLLQISHCSNSRSVGICISFCGLSNFLKTFCYFF